MPKKSTWKVKYEREWKAFQKRIQIAEERGLELPSKIYDIQKARGGYKQAYSTIHYYSQKQIERASKAYSIQRERELEAEEERLAKEASKVAESVTVGMSEETMAQEDVRRSIIEEVEFYLDLIQNKGLKYKLKKLYANYIVNNYWDTLNNLKDDSSNVISLLQEAATVPYYTKGVSQEFLDDIEAKETRIAGDFERILKGSYTDSDRKDNAERS